MKAEIKKEVAVTLVLSEQEARLLMVYVQNPICDPSEEDKDISDLRHNLFDSIKQALYGNYRQSNG